MLAGKAARSMRRCSVKYCAASVPAIGRAACQRRKAHARLLRRCRFAARETGPFRFSSVFSASLAIEPLDHHEPIDLIAMGAAAEAMKVIIVNRQAGRAIVVKRTAQFAVDQWFADQTAQ